MKFSVGRLRMGTETIAKCVNITLRIDGNPVSLYAGGYMDPRAVEIGNRATTVSIEFAEWNKYNPNDVLPNNYVDVELLPSAADSERGVSGVILTNCKATSYECAQTQNGFVTYRMEFTYALNS